MPHKFNTSRRHKFAKKKYRVTNWCGYNESLRNRGDLTVWITGDARKHWAAPRRRSPTSDLLKARFGEAVEIIIPPPNERNSKPALQVFSLTCGADILLKFKLMAAWPGNFAVRYNQRSRVETQMGRWKAIIGSKLKARCCENQHSDTKIDLAILNKMTEVGRPVFKQIS